MTNNVLRTAVGYIRVSTRDQADSGLSLTAQRDKCEVWAKLNDLDLVEIIEDAGYSAKSLDRPGMKRLLALVRGRRVGVVIVAKLDRITRSVADLGRLIELFKKYGVEFASVADNLDTSTASGRLLVNMLASISQWEREIIGERTSESLAVLRSNGRRISRYAPYGYRLNGNNWIEDEHEQDAICIMQRLRGEGLSLRKIAASLGEQGFLSRSGSVLSCSTIRSTLIRCLDGGR